MYRLAVRQISMYSYRQKDRYADSHTQISLLKERHTDEQTERWNRRNCKRTYEHAYTDIQTHIQRDIHAGRRITCRNAVIQIDEPADILKDM